MHIVVFGTGGVGGYFGGRLAKSGEHVTFIARKEHLQALQTNGLRVYSIKGDFILPKIQVTDKPYEAGLADVVLVATKAWQVPEAAWAIKSIVGEQTIIVPLQNGVESPSQLAAVLGRERVLGGLCWIVSYIETPGVIRHIGVEPHVIFGNLDNTPNERIQRLYHAFVRAGIQVSIAADIRSAIWEKFTFISTMSGIASVTRMPVGILRSLPQTRQMIEHAIDEVIAVAWAQGIILPDDIFDRTMNYIDSMPPESTLSMQRDIMEGRPSELESQSGAVVRLGQEVGVVTPIHHFIYCSLLPMELRVRGRL